MSVVKEVKELLKRSQLMIDLYEKLNTAYFKRLYEKNPRLSAEAYYKRHHHGEEINLDNPRNLEEKIAWLALNTDTSVWTRCTDKYAVRGYIEEKGCGDTLVPLYGKWDTAEEVDFDSLPNSFVMKTNNGCGTVLIVKDKSKLNTMDVRKKLTKWLKKPYGYEGWNGHYLSIKPCLIAEAYLDDHSQNGILIDYKCFCIYGEIKAIVLYSDRRFKGHTYKANVYDKDWNLLHESRVENVGEQFEKPATLPQMVEACKKLAGDFPFVRVDFYQVDGKLVFGELTFTPETLMLTDEFNEKIGNLIDLSICKH